jgi:hypothetical protein
MFAHSLRLVLPRITAPASRNRRTRKASSGGREPTRASDPAVVAMRSAVSILSLMSNGMPCNGPRGPLAFRSLSSASAMSSASGLVSITLLRAGPFRSMASMRARYFSARERALCFPDFIPSCRSAMVISSSSNGSTLPTALACAVRSAGNAAMAEPSKPV